ncbi:alpha/beta fold hydrolase [Actinomyces sp. 2119]|uniref:Alpha/beta fold hydrolase n=1 Tax=Actinomyces lilanjuaniae TaxID=2321394 RepID=A0ABN5PPM7_9ACTO|nr:MULTISPECIES: alpha/beta fold hydrolase [Actinomyces]AYD90358.1 alpha/beta fold hydrolase [Actinomyces lilanjuaniae]RJF40932.1 alpha/beta fold hydrolase [Actinomyces sp. 2119]
MSTLRLFDGPYADAPVEHVITPAGTSFAYRAVGSGHATPLLLLVHLAATLDGWDPLVVDQCAQDRPVIAVDYPGMGGSSGAAPTTVAGMAESVITFLDAAGLEQVDILGLSLGGFVTQQLLLAHPHRFRRAVLAGTGPAGGRGITRVPTLTFQAMAKAAATRKDPRHYLFFPPAAWDRADEFLERVSRFRHPDRPARVPGLLRQLVAVYRWGRQAPQDLSALTHPALVVNGDQDLMVPSPNTIDLGHRLPAARLEELYPGAGHGAVFQEPGIFSSQVREFLG